jgi:hypothetical protein
MIDWSTFLWPFLLSAVGSILGASLGFALLQAGIFHNFTPAIMIFPGSGMIAGFAIGMRLRKSRAPLKPSTKTGVRLFVAFVLILGAIAEAFPDLLRGRISWRLVGPTAGIIVGVALLVPSARLTSTKSVRMMVVVAASIWYLLALVSDYKMKNFSDLGMLLAIFFIVFFWSLIRRWHGNSNATSTY